MIPAFVLIRAVHFAACLLMLGVWAFDRFMVRPVIGPMDGEIAAHWDRIARRLTAVILPAALVSGALWLMFVAANMSGQPLDEAIKPAVLTKVWDATTFGTVWQWHLGCWCAAALAAGLATTSQTPAPARAALAWAALFAGAALAGGLAGAGHGLDGGIGHQLADVMHLLAAGFWPAGLVPFFCLLLATRRLPSAHQTRIQKTLTLRFSTMSLFAAAILTATGIINAWTLLGSIDALVSTAYGRWLLAKILLFLLMLGFGAANLLRWRPRLSHHDNPTHPAAGNTDRDAEAVNWIQFNVAIELFLAGAVMIIVGILGQLPHPD